MIEREETFFLWEEVEEGKQDHTIKWGCASIENLGERWNGGEESGKRKKKKKTRHYLDSVCRDFRRKKGSFGYAAFEVNKGWVLKKK